MSASLNPSSSLGFKRPLTQLVKRNLTITNHNSQPIAFKVKTTAPKLYCVRPNSGRVEPGESLDVSVMLQALRDEPPLNAKCKDKFLIQSTLITAEKETMALQDIWNVAADGSDESRVHQQKLRVTYLPAEGQTLEEEDEPQANTSTLLLPTDSQFDTARQARIFNGHSQPIPEFNMPPIESQQAPRSNTPPADFSVAREDSHDTLAHIPHVSEPAPPSPAPPPADQLDEDSELEYVAEHVPEPAPQPLRIPEPLTMPEPIHDHVSAAAPALVVEVPNAALLAKYQAAQTEIERLRAILATVEDAPTSELRRRRPALSDDGASVAETDALTAFEDGQFQHQQEGVPLQVVVIIALGVFITTYLFF